MTQKNSTRQIYSTNTIWEQIAGFSRAIRVGNHIFIAGTTATGPDGLVGVGDPAKQMHFILDRITAAVTHLGGKLEDIVRTRIYVRHISDWEIIARIHGEKFKMICPATTLIEACLVGECLVEVEAEALVL